jgi:large subunit ribosomal protein L15
MQFHNLQSKNISRSKKRIGRGGKRGTYSGKGMKGQKSRSGTGGTNIPEKGRSSWVKRFPKLGGFNSVYRRNLIVQSKDLAKFFKDGDTVTLQSLIEKKLLKNPKRGFSGKMQSVKILNNGLIDKKLFIKGCLVSKEVKKMVEKAGGSVENFKGNRKKALPKIKNKKIS